MPARAAVARRASPWSLKTAGPAWPHCGSSLPVAVAPSLSPCQSQNACEDWGPAAAGKGPAKQEGLGFPGLGAPQRRLNCW